MSFTGLPGELLLDIFELAGGGELRMSAAITFSHLNRACRQLALSTPSLWSVLSAHLGADCATVFARRSQSHSLDIRINGMSRALFAESNNSNTPLPGGLRDFMSAAVMHFDRCTRLLIEAYFADTLKDMHRHLVNEWRRMQVPPSKVDTVILRLRHCEEHPSPAITLAYESFDYIPFPPRTLELDGVPAWQSEYELCSSSLEQLVLRNLVFFSLASIPYGGLSIPGTTPSLAQLLDILPNSPYLRKLILDGATAFDDGYNTIPVGCAQGGRVTMSRLQSISLAWTSALTAYRLFSMLSTPALRSLHLHLEQKDDSDLAWRTLIEFRDPTPLEELYVRMTINSPVGQRDSPFARFSNLRVLELDETQIQNRIVRDLINLPRLRHLALRFEPFISVDALEECVLSRLGNDRVCAIEHLEVVHCKNFTPEDETIFEELVPNLTWCADDEEEDGDYIPYGSDSSSDTMSDSDPDAEVSDSDLRGITGFTLLLPVD
ncbi:hypothetical protein EXIGLDRAFT_759002 [Exidia glandulosa HHB12029]|uniref:F-box domain-containing protein n=1 Tax=Exidia glandulosa HHB12029 TaxID=1314781 RepID=A0A165QIA3_EXIGL|nr:hypothetical protein EXIGLDRAFT_759002 [Exidia glandulosa HHB12029]